MTDTPQNARGAQWRTIASAPKDGTAILGFPIFGYNRPREIYWFAGKWICPGTTGAQEPTMWTDWPAAPSAGVTLSAVGADAPPSNARPAQPVGSEPERDGRNESVGAARAAAGEDTTTKEQNND